MISPRSGLSVIRLAASALTLAFAASCDSGLAPVASDATAGPLTSGSASRAQHDEAGCPGSSGGDCEMEVGLLLNRLGQASLIVRTGGFDELTGERHANGTFNKIQYKIFDSRGKLVSTTNDNDATGTIYRATLPGLFHSTYRVDVDANIENQSGKKGTAVVRGSATAAYAPDIDLSTESIDLIRDGVRRPLEPVVANASNTYTVDVANLMTIGDIPSTAGIQTRCVVVVDGQVQTPGVSPGFSYVGSASQYVAPGETKQCTFMLDLAPGPHDVRITAVPEEPFLDADETNNSATAVVIAGNGEPATTDLIVRSILPIAPVASGTEVTYVAAVGVLPNGSQTSTPFSCTVTVTRASTNAPGGGLTMLASDGTATTTADGECRFKLTSLFNNEGESDTYTIKVVVSAPSGVTDVTPANNELAADQVVEGATISTIDLFVRSIDRDLGGDVAPLGQIPAGVAATYVATIGAVPGAGNQTSATATCVATATNLRTNQVVGTVTGTVAGPATTTSDALCRFSFTLAGNGDLDEDYRITVTALPTSATELAPANNALSANQTAIVRVDLSIAQVTLTVDGAVQSSLGTIPQGKTGSYTATIFNGSSRSATTTCIVTAAPGAGLPVPVVASPAGAITIPSGQSQTCSFSYSFPQLVAVNFLVSAAEVLPVDGDLTNNVVGFQTVSVSDHKFPNIGAANIQALQDWEVDASGVPVLLRTQSANFFRIALAFTDFAEVIGDFRAMVNVTSDNQAISRANLTALDLRPGGIDSPNCADGLEDGVVTVNGQMVRLRICAKAVPDANGNPTNVQEIFVEYSTATPLPIANPSAATLFGSELSFDVSLDWTLEGASLPDGASALVRFFLEERNTGDPLIRRIVQTGEAVVLRDGR